MATQSELESAGIQAASRAAKNQGFEVAKEVTLSNGVVLKIKPMPPMLLTSVQNSIPEPAIPVVFLEDKGRDEPNPNHPEYIRAMNERAEALAMATSNLILYACTSAVSVPEGVFGPDDDGWVRLTEMAGIKFDKNDKIERYLAWLRSYAVATIDDMNKVQTLPLQLAGTMETEVEAVQDSFRSAEVPGADSELPDEIGSKNGHNVPSGTSRSRSRN